MPRMTRLIDHGAGQPATYAAPPTTTRSQQRPQGDPALIRLANAGAGAARYGLKRIPPDALTHARADYRAAWLTGYDAEAQLKALDPATYAQRAAQRQAEMTPTSPSAPDGSYGLNVKRLAAIARGPRLY